jgi:hypothetical protein
VKPTQDPPAGIGAREEMGTGSGRTVHKPDLFKNTPVPVAISSQALRMAITCEVVAHAHVQFALEEVPLLRQRPGPGAGQSLPANILKHADEQTVAGLAAVLHAMADFDLTATSFDQWGIVAAPCFLGRATLVLSRERYAAEGAWGLSPHFIPHRSQHAVSGTISQVLKIHGPNFGTGGGPGAVREALVGGAILAQDNPGVWVVMTGWEPEFIPNAEGRPTGPVICHALALALTGARAAQQGAWLRIVPQSAGARNGSDTHPVSLPAPTLLELAQALADRPAASWSWPEFGCIEWSGSERPANGTARAQSLAGRSRSRDLAPAAEDRARGEGIHSYGAGTENAR